MTYRTPAGRRVQIALTIPELPARVLGPVAAQADFVEVDARLVAGEGYVFDRVALLALRLEEGRLDPPGAGPVWIAPDRGRVRLRVRPAWGKHEVGTPGRVEVIFRRVEEVEGDPEIAGHADVTVGPHGVIVLASGAATSATGFFTGPASMSPPLVVAAGGIVRVGLRVREASTTAIRATAAPLVLETWLEGEARPRGLAAPEAVCAVGRVEVGWSPAAPDAAIVTIDPRAEDGRWVVGRHALTLTWRTRRWPTATVHRTTTHVVVDEDGQVELAG